MPVCFRMTLPNQEFCHDPRRCICHRPLCHRLAGRVCRQPQRRPPCPGQAGSPFRQHGFHVHEVGDCSAADASSAKGHFNPAGKGHGHHHGPERHAGDLPNLVADAAGRATYRAEVDMLTLDKGPMGIVGRSLVVHADPDDYRSQPAGNSGKRVACGVIAGV